MSQFVKTKILVVDDDEHICELIRLYFEKEGFAVNIANDGNKAIESFKSATPDVVILDIMLPGADGWQVCREIREVSSKPIIMISVRSRLSCFPQREKRLIRFSAWSLALTTIW